MTDTIEKNVAVDGAVGNEGERSSSAFSMARGTPVGSLGPGQRWSAGRKREVIEGGDMTGEQGPVALADTHSVVRQFHVATGVVHGPPAASQR